MSNLNAMRLPAPQSLRQLVADLLAGKAYGTKTIAATVDVLRLLARDKVWMAALSERAAVWRTLNKCVTSARANLQSRRQGRAVGAARHALPVRRRREALRGAVQGACAGHRQRQVDGDEQELL